MTPERKTNEQPPQERTRPDDPVDAAVEAIKSDATRAPDAYARETIVPEGGE